MEYSVIDRPIISVMTEDGTENIVSLRELFEKAHKYRDLYAVSPLEWFSVLRFLVAFAMDMLHPKNHIERRKLFKAGMFSLGKFDEYVKMCETNGSCFDLFDKNRPFMQSAYREEYDAKSEQPIASIVFHLQSGHSHMFYDHRLENEHKLTIPQAFRALLTSYAFSLYTGAGGGNTGGYSNAVNGRTPLYISAIGKNLFETIVINMLSIDETGRGSNYYGVGDVPWRKYRVIEPGARVADITLLEGLLFMPRRLLLLPKDDGTVDHVIRQRGLDFVGRQTSSWRDPNTSRKAKKDGSIKLFLASEGIDIWRNVDAFIPETNNENISLPLVITNYQQLYDDDNGIPVNLTLRALGLLANNSKVTGWCDNTLVLPSGLITSPEKGEIFCNDLNFVKQVYEQIKKSNKICARLIGSKLYDRKFLLEAEKILYSPKNLDEILHGESVNVHKESFAKQMEVILDKMLSQLRKNCSDYSKNMCALIVYEDEIRKSYAKKKKSWLKK